MTLSMKKVVTSLGVIVFVAAIIAGATGAFFSDTETSTGNTFAAGDIDLRIDNTSYVTNEAGVLVASPNNSWEISDLDDQLFFSFSDVKPGDIGEDTISIHPGTNDAYACMAADITATPDNSINDPEGDAGDVTDGNGGELQNFLNFSFWEDDGDNVYEVGESIITQLTGVAGTIFNGAWLPIADSANGPALEGNSTTYVGKAWCFGTLTPAAVAQDGNGSSTPLVRGTGFTCDGSGNNNIAQTDGITVDVSFYAVQARNNGQFTCASLPPFVGEGGEEPVGPVVGAVLADYVAPTCDVDVATIDTAGIEATTINGGVEIATAGQTVCVAPGTYEETVLLNKDVTLASTGGAGVTTITGGVNISASGATVTGFEINPGSFLGTNAALYVNGSLSNILLSYNDIDGLDEALSRGIETTIGSSYSNVVISNNVIHDLVTGIYTNPHTGSLTIEFNDIDDNAAGIGGLNGAIVRNNEFEHSSAAQEAIGVDSANDANPATVEFNNFLDDTRINTYGTLTPDLDAENNFFGPNGGANQTGGTDEVDFTPETLAQYTHNS